MGSRGPTGRGQGHREVVPLRSVHAPARREPPEPPAGLSELIRLQWDTFWESEVAHAVQDADLPVLGRLFMLRDEWARLMRSFRKRRYVLGSAGQAVISPAATELHRIEGDLRALESQFGLTPASRLRLGLSGARMTASLEELARDAGEAEDTDPRLAATVEDHSER